MSKLNRYENLKDEVERAIRPFIKVKIYLRGEAERERLEKLLKNEYYLERVERLTHLFLERNGASFLIIPLDIPVEDARRLERDENFLSKVEELVRSAGEANGPAD
ncbi:MAG: hypothetical protein QI197_05260 [Candidatus Korarchaeota archaeon]|nr:hypothetical protein [Candidatus Korarchaeota archaeon]